MAQTVQLPNGAFFPVKEGETREQALSVAQQMYPDAFRAPEEAKPKQDTTGFKAAAAAGIERLKGETALTAGKLGLMKAAEAEEYQKAQEEKAKARFTPTEKGWTEDPYLKFKETLGGSVPYMLAPAAAGIAALALPEAAAGAAALGGAGLLSAGQFTGTNLARQMDTGKTLEQTSLGKAVGAAIPQAALDTAAMALLPGIGKLFGSVGEKLTTAQARAIADQTLGRAAADYVAKTGAAMGREGLTETAQQVLERLQAGLSITDPEARKEYVDSFVGGAALAGVGAPIGRYTERSAARAQAEAADIADKKELAKQNALAQKEEQARLEAERNTPEYAQKVVADYQAAEKARADLEKQIKKISKDSPTYTADKEHNKDIGLQLKQQAATLKGLAGEYNRVKDIAAQAEQNKPFELTPSPAELPEAEKEPTESPMQMLERKRQAQQLLENNQQELSDHASSQDMAAFDSAMKQRKVLMSEVTHLDTQLKALGVEDNQIDPAAVQAQIAKETEKLANMAGPGFDPDKAEKQRAKITKLQTQLQNATNGQMGLDLGAPRTLELPLTAAQNQRKAMAAQGTAAGAQRIGTVEEEEQAALQAQRAEEERIAQEAEANRIRASKVAPEMAALQRMRQRPSPITENLGLFGNEEGRPTTSPAFSQMQQELLGTPEEERMLPTAEDQEQKPRDLRRVPGAEFKLRPGESSSPINKDTLADRLNYVLSAYDLSPEAVEFLRRAEKILPQADTTIKTDLSAQTNKGLKRGVGESESFMTLLDQQLSRIESGEEGVPRKGQPRTASLLTMPPTASRTAAASTTAPTEAGPRQIEPNRSVAPGSAESGLKTPIAQPESEERTTGVRGRADVTKIASDNTPSTLRGPSARAGDLSMGDALEPHLRLHEGLAQDNTKQQALFPEEQEKLGAIKTNRGLFQIFMKSKFVQNLRNQLRRDEDIAKRAQAIPELEKRANALVAEIEDILKQYAEYRSAESVVKANKDVAKAKRDIAEIRAAAGKSTVDRMLLAGAIENLQQARKQVYEQGYKEGGVEELIADIDAVNNELQSAQSDIALLNSALSVLDGQMQSFAAIQRLTALIDKAPSVYRIDQAKVELQAVRTELGKIQEENSDLQKRLRKSEVEKRRADEAVKITKQKEAEEAGRIKPAEQTLNNLPSYDQSTQYPALTEAQRLARERGGKEPELSAAEQARINGDPVQVLGGYRSRVRDLEKKIKNRQDATRANLGKETVGPAQAKYDELNAAYKAAKSTAERDRIGAQRDAADAALQKAKEDLKTAPITWRGMKKDIAALADALNNEAWLEGLVDEGRVELEGPTAAEVRGAPTEKELAAQRTKAVADALVRAEGPATSGEPLTRSQVAKANKPQKTLYEGKGVPAEEEKARTEENKRKSGADIFAEMQKTATEKVKQAQATGEGVVFRTVETKGTPTLETQQVENLAKRVTEGWVNAPVIKVVANEKGLPVRILNQLTADEKRGKVPGLYDTQTKTVYLVADALHNANDVILTIAHEAAGHHGLRELLGGTYTKVMNDIFAGNKEVRQQAQAKMAAEPNLSQQVAVEEVLAELAEKPAPTPAEKNALQRIYAALKQWFAKTFNLPNVTDAEVQQLVANARQYVIEGREAAEGQAPKGEAVLRTKTAAPTNALEQLAQDVVAGEKTWREKVGNHIALQAEMQAVDMRAGLQAALKAGAKELGDENLYTQAMYNVRKADQKMPLIDTVMRLGPLELYKDEKGLYGVRSTNKNSAKDVFEAISALPYKDAAQKDRIATLYMIAQRAANKGLTKLDLGALGVTEEKLKEAMAVVDADPALKDALENVRRVYNEYNKGMINFLVETRRISKDFAKELLKDGDYVPYYRVQDNGLATLNFGNNKMVTVGDIRRQPYLAKLKGGETKILPISESIPRNTLLLTDMALTNMATRSVAYGLQAIGKGKGDIDPATGKPKNVMAIHSGDGPADGRTIRFYEEPDPNKPDDDGKRWVQVDTGGTSIEGIPAELVVQSLEGAHLALPEILKLAGAAGDLLRTGVTRTPLYIARQLFKDPMAAAFTGGLNYNAFTAVLKAGKEFVQMTRGQSENEAKLLEKGLIQSGIFAGDVSDMKKMALQIASGKDTNTVNKIFAALDRAAMRADATTRALVMENALKNGLSEVEADMATMESMNFYKRGLSPTIQYANRLIPFLNAQIQGLNVLYKAATGKMPFEEQQKIKRKFLNNAALLTATGLVYAMAMEDDEYFRNAKPRDKYSNFFLHLPGVDEPLKLPIPYEAGYFFSLAVAAVDGMREETDGAAQWRALKDMFLNSIPGYSSMGVPQLAKPAFEVWTNKNFLTGAPIESARLQGLSPEERYNTTTTELAKSLAKAVPILSPIQIEHLVRGYLGVLPLAAAAGANSLFESEGKGERPEGRTSDLPLIGTQFQKKYGGADNEVVFHLADEAKEARTTFNNMLKEGRREEALEYRDSHRVALASASAAGSYQQLIGRINLDIRRTQERNDLSAAEKRERLDKLDEAKQAAAQRFIQLVKRLEGAAS